MVDSSDDSDDSSSPVTLDQFRQKWQKELEVKKKSESKKLAKALVDKVIDDELSDDKKAEKLFLDATDLERKGKVFEAMRLYRRAVQLDPDIEFKIYEQSKNAVNNNVGARAASAPRDNKNSIGDGCEEEDLSEVNLVERFHASILNGNGTLFERGNAGAGVIVTGGLHISDLPMEVILIILKWVVSSHLDIRSLEQCSMVSKGFYLCARDNEIWKLACKRVWGRGASLTKESGHTSWRGMFIERPRVCFNGCYISKTSYIRYGERSFQDQFYRPVHLIEYYRYLRFFPDGTVLMLTTADEPQHAVYKLQNRNRSDILKGHFRFNSDIVTIIVKKNEEKKQHNRMRGFADFELNDRSFVLQLQMTYTKKRRMPQLVWQQYSVNITMK